MGWRGYREPCATPEMLRKAGEIRRSRTQIDSVARTDKIRAPRGDRRPNVRLYGRNRACSGWRAAVVTTGLVGSRRVGDTKGGMQRLRTFYAQGRTPSIWRARRLAFREQMTQRLSDKAMVSPVEFELV